MMVQETRIMLSTRYTYLHCKCVYVCVCTLCAYIPQTLSKKNMVATIAYINITGHLNSSHMG